MRTTSTVTRVAGSFSPIAASSALALALLTTLTLTSGCDDPSKKAPAATVGAPLSASAMGGTLSTGVEALEFSNATSSIKFVGSKVTGSHEGSFSRFHGTVHLANDKTEASHVSAEIDADSLTIEPPKLLGHLKSADFFDVAKFSKIVFASTALQPGVSAEATHLVTGNLTMHGKEKAISFPAAISITDRELGAKAEFSINRRDFDIVYPGMPNDLIRDGVVVKLDLHAPRRASM